MATPGVGKDIDAFCSKCDLLLGHVVVAKVGDTVKRVKCSTCGAEHAFHAAKKVPAVRKAGGPAKRGALKASDYDTLMRGRDLSRARRYKTDEHFAKNEIVNHPQFGIGLVVQIKDTSKIEVAFADGPKTLIHAAI